MKQTAEDLRELRRAAGLSQEDVGLLAGVSRSQICHVEHGRRTSAEDATRLRRLLSGAILARRMAADWILEKHTEVLYEQESF